MLGLGHAVVADPCVQVGRVLSALPVHTLAIHVQRCEYAAVAKGGCNKAPVPRGSSHPCGGYDTHFSHSFSVYRRSSECSWKATCCLSKLPASTQSQRLRRHHTVPPRQLQDLEAAAALHHRHGETCVNTSSSSLPQLHQGYPQDIALSAGLGGTSGRVVRDVFRLLS